MFYSSTLSLTSDPDGVAWSTPRSGLFTPGEQTLYPFYKKLGGPATRGLDGWGKFRPFLETFEMCTFFQLYDTQRLETLYMSYYFLILPRSA